MKLTVLELNDSHRQIYDEFINLPKHSKHIMFYHTWQWGIFMESTARQFVRVGVFDGNNLVATAQVSLQFFRGGSFWYCPRGLVVDYSSAKLVKYAHLAVKEYFRGKSGAAFFRVDPNIIKSDSEINTFDEIGAKKAGLFIQAQRVWISEIFANEEEQIRWGREHGMRRKLPNQMRKGIREGVTVRVSDSMDDLELLIKLLKQMDSRKGGIGKRDDDYYRKQFSTMAPSGYEKLFIAERNGKVLAVNLFAIFANEASYLHGASLDEDRELSAPSILHVKSMVYIKQNFPNVVRYNFWGVISNKNAVKSNPHNGYSEFKRSFGGYEVEYADPRDFVYNYARWRFYWLIEKYRKKKSRRD